MRMWGFFLQVAEQLIGDFSNRKIAPPKRPIDGVHTLDKIQGRKKTCKVCTTAGRKTTKGRYVCTNFVCSKCGMEMCLRPCFEEHHLDRNLSYEF
jgi:hypothetical protein